MKDEFLSQYMKNELSHITLPERISEQYVLEACLKHTAEKQIYLLHSESDNSRFILKRTLLSSKERVLDEYVILSSLQHELIPKAVGYTEDGTYSYLIREYIPGRSLFDLVENFGPFDEEKMIGVLVPFCDVLSYMHHQKPAVIHRDIKPQNIIFTPDGQCKLIDMGTSRRFKKAETQDTIFMGTQITAAPEQYGYRQTDQRSDIYALGVLMVYLLTGSFRIENGLPDTVSKTLKRVIARCLEFDPNRRYSNVDKLKRRLQFCIQARKKSPILVKGSIGISVLLVLCLAGTYFLTRPDPSKTVTFQSLLLEKAVRQELGKPDKVPILKEEMKNVTQLLICGDTVFSDWNQHNQYSDMHNLGNVTIRRTGFIASLQELKLCKNLSTLVLDKQNISDISALKGLPLKKLSLCDNHITDISPLKDCKRLTVLKLEHNPITDIRPVKELDLLETLDVGFSNVADISPLKNRPILELYLLNTNVEDFTPLKSMPQLDMLTLRFLPPKGLQVVTELTNLKQLTIYESGIDNVDIFSKMTGLERLDLTANDLYDLSGVEKLGSLRSISLGNNHIKSLEPLTKLDSLDSVDIVSSSISDLEPLTRIARLHHISCDNALANLVKQLPDADKYEIEIR